MRTFHISRNADLKILNAIGFNTATPDVLYKFCSYIRSCHFIANSTYKLLEYCWFLRIFLVHGLEVGRREEGWQAGGGELGAESNFQTQTAVMCPYYVT